MRNACALHFFRAQPFSRHWPDAAKLATQVLCVGHIRTLKVYALTPPLVHPDCPVHWVRGHGRHREDRGTEADPPFLPQVDLQFCHREGNPNVNLAHGQS